MLTVHRAGNSAVLVHHLAASLAAPPGDTFASEVVAVPAKGVERWIAQRLSHLLGAASGDGVCANVDFPWPSTMLDEALSASSPELEHAVDAWAPARVVWPLLEVIDACAATEPWCRPLAQHLGVGKEDRGRRLAVASRLARHYDEYGQSRPEMIKAWAAGRDERGDGTPLEGDLAWQPELWRALRRHLGASSPAELLDEACSRLRNDPERSSLPERLSVFGASRLSPARLMVLAALAEHRDVHLWLYHPSPALWHKIGAADPVPRRRADTSHHLLENPLLASLSRDVLELQLLLGWCAPGFRDVVHVCPDPPSTLLGRLKLDLADDRVGTAPPLLDLNDRSVQVHACHGRTRQVEVLREVVVGLLAADPTLEPRDVLVMCPDVDTFAPLIASTFSLGATQDSAHPAARLRVRLADRALRRTNALLGVLAQLLELGTARITASQVLDLASSPAVRERFGFDEDEVERLRGWVIGAGVRWGLDCEHRSAWQLEGIEQGTWRAGLNRLLVGVAMEGVFDSWGEVVPLDDIDSADIDLAGRLSELVDRLDAAQSLMSGQHTAVTWMNRLADAVLALAAPAPDSAWQQHQLRGELADIAKDAATNRSLLGLADVRALLEPTLAGRPTRANFRTGTMTVCTLVPMRSVPHRVICLLGLDDGVFPRQGVRDGDDVLARDPWVGERDPSSEDRQLLLDAIFAAEEHLVITYTGADERTGAVVPPAVPLGELLDALDRTATGPDGGRVRDSVTMHHPLQPFDGRNFLSAALGRDRPFSFDPLAYAGAVAAAGGRTAQQSFLAAALPALPPADIQLDALIKMFEHPARGFLRQRLQVAVTRPEEEPADAIQVCLDSLERWAVGERLLRQRLTGLEPAACMALERRLGQLPPGALADAVLQSVGREVEPLIRASRMERQHDPEAYDVDVSLADGTHLAGTVTGVRNDVILSLTYSKLSAKHRMRAWVELAALTAARPDRAWRSVAVGRGERGRGPQRSLFGPLPVEEANAALAELTALYRAALCSPLPLPCKSAAQYALFRRRGSGVPAARIGAERMWVAGSIPGEQEDAEHVLIYGRVAPLSALTGQAAEPGERGPGWSVDETDRFGVLARRLWGRLLDAETTVQT